jgi:hypothetical protein
VIANGNGDTNWDALPGLREYTDADPTPANIRWFVDVLNHIMIENYMLRRELVRHRSEQDEQDAALYEVTVAAPGTQPEDSADQTGAEEAAQSDTAPSYGDIHRPRGRTQRASRPATDVSNDKSRNARQPASERAYEHVVNQIEALGDEIVSLRTEVRSALWQMPADRRTLLVPRQPSTSEGPRFEAIRSNRSDLTFEADPHPGMWMKLRQPWFYLPLIWVTLIGMLALAVFFVFLD